MQTVFASPYFRVELDAARDLLVIRRTELAYASLEEIPSIFEAVIRAVQPYAGKPLLTDLRLSVGNNLPHWERVITPLVKRLNAPFPLRAVLVRTAAGKLQMQRLARERGDISINIFADEASALAYLFSTRKTS